jgi:hypothetical protein
MFISEVERSSDPRLLGLDRSLRQALDQGRQGLLQYLQGPWYWADEGSTPMVIIFEPDEEVFTVVQNNTLEIYDVVRAERTYRTGMVFKLTEPNPELQPIQC